METPEPLDAEAKHYAEIGLTPDGVCRKTYVPDQVKADEDSRRVSFVISTGAVDRDNDTIKVEGWDFQNWLKAGAPVLFGHNGSIPAVAKGLAVVKRGGAIYADAQFPPKGIYDLADTVFGLIKTIGVPGAASVGFRPKKGKYSWNEERGGVDFEEQELLEFSIVNVPANQEAILRLAKDFSRGAEAGVDLDPIRKALALSAPEPTPEPVPAVEKAGRRLSSKTEASLRSAHKSASEAVEHLTSVLETAEEQMDEPKAPESVLYVSPSPAKPGFQVTPQDVKAAVVAAVSEAVKSAINHARGRLD